MQSVVAYFSSNGLPALGLSPTIRIREILVGSPTAELVVNNEPMIEIGDGYYVYYFTSYDPLTDYTFIADGGSSLVQGDRFVVGATESPDPQQNAAAVWNDPAADAMQSLIDTLLKYQENRTRVDPVAKTLTIYDSDGITPLKVFDLKDSSGNKSLVSVYERTPQ